MTEPAPGAEWSWWVPPGITGHEPAVVIRDRDGIGRAAIESLRATGLVPARPLGVTTGAMEDVEKLRPIGILVDLVIAPPGLLGEHALGVVHQLWARGRWRFEVSGPGGAAGALPLDQRTDPLLVAARLVLATREIAYRYGCLATIDHLEVSPGTPGRIPELVRLGLDACGPEDADLLGLVQELVQLAAQSGASAAEESWAPSAVLDPVVRDRIARRGQLPLLSLNADPVARAGVPTGVIAVRDGAHEAASAVLTDVLRGLIS